MNKLKILTIVPIVICSIAYFSKAGHSEQQRCKNIQNPKIGQRCLDVQRIHARGDNNSDSFKSTQDPSWAITAVEPHVFTRYGNTEGPHIREYAPDTKLKSQEQWNIAIENLEKLKARAEGTDPETKQNMAYEYVNEQLEQFKNNRDSLVSVNTNYGYIEATVHASRRCKAKTPLGCADWQGGSFGVDLHIYKVYIGSPQAANSSFRQVESKALSLIEQQNQYSNSSESSTEEQNSAEIENEQKEEGFRIQWD